MNGSATERIAGPGGISILWHDASCLVINKPWGLATQAPAGIDSVERRLRNWLAGGTEAIPKEVTTEPRVAQEDGVSSVSEGSSTHRGVTEGSATEGSVTEGSATESSVTEGSAPRYPPYLGIPHRLDRCTSGVMIFALRVKAARKLSRQFERREVEKVYWALVAGQVYPPSGTWEDTLRKIPGEARSEVVEASASGGRHARLDYRVVCQHPQVCWLELRLHTGRMHQIRIQAASRGHAVVGDVLYGSQIPFSAPGSDRCDSAIALHAAQLGFRHPVSGKRMRLSAPLPPTWADFVK